MKLLPFNFIFLLFLSPVLYAEINPETELNQKIFKIFLATAEKEIQLADNVEFDLVDYSVYSISRQDAKIQYRPRAWKWIYQNAKPVLRMQLLSAVEVDVQFTILHDTGWVGILSKKSRGYAELLELFGGKAEEVNIHFKPRNPADDGASHKKILGVWHYGNLNFEFEMAGKPMIDHEFIHLNNNNIEIRDDEDKRIVQNFEWNTSSLGKYIRIIHLRTRGESVHFIHRVSETNLFLTTGFDGEIKNMHLKKAKDFVKDGVGFAFFHAKGFTVPIIPHKSYNLIQEVEKTADGVVMVRRKNILLPDEIEGVYPLKYPNGSVVDVYLRPNKYVNADHPEIKAFAKKILDGKQFTNQHELVKYVIRSCAKALKYGNSDLIPSASDALKDGVSNCIGYAHLPAAVLRYLGIPTRNIRAYLTSSVQITTLEKDEVNETYRLGRDARKPWIPHYLLEVYYPSLNQWVSFDAQTNLSQVILPCVVLYESPDWDMVKHRNTRPLADDPNLIIFGNNHPRTLGNNVESGLVTGITPERFFIGNGPFLNVITKQNSDEISKVGYYSETGNYVPLIKDEDNDRKWSMWKSSLSHSNSRFNYKDGDEFRIRGGSIEVVDKYGSTVIYRGIQSPDYAKYQYIFDLKYYKSILQNVQLKDLKNSLIEYAFCGDEVFSFDRKKTNSSLPARSKYEFRINQQQEMILVIHQTQPKVSPITHKIKISDDAKFLNIGSSVYEIVNDRYCN